VKEDKLRDDWMTKLNFPKSFCFRKLEFDNKDELVEMNLDVNLEFNETESNDFLLKFFSNEEKIDTTYTNSISN
jgi:hypothetical protein